MSAPTSTPSVSFDSHDTDFITNRYNGGGMKFVISDGELKEQRQVSWDLVKRVGKELLNGRDLVSISLPVQLFEPRSFLQRLADGWVYAPLYLNKAAACTDPIERMKLVVCFAVSGLHLSCTYKKPFNPIIGETLQTGLEDGTSIYLEQTTHHPPASNWEVFGPNESYHFWGYGVWSASCRANTVKGFQVGPNHIDFPDGTRITYNIPDVHVRGVMWGDRYVEFSGRMTFRDEKNNLTCELNFAPDAIGMLKSLFTSAKTPSDTIRGELFTPVPVRTAADYRDVHCKVNGSWLGFIDFDDVRYWDIRYAPKAATVDVDSPLPSDSIYREDLIALLSKQVDRAQELKSVLEEQQRYDAKMRKNRDAELKKLAKTNSKVQAQLAKKSSSSVSVTAN